MVAVCLTLCENESLEPAAKTQQYRPELSLVFLIISGQEAKEATRGDAVTIGQQRLGVDQVFGVAAFQEAEDGEGGRLVGRRQR